MNTDYNPALWCKDMPLLLTAGFFLPVDAFVIDLIANEENV